MYYNFELLHKSNTLGLPWIIATLGAKPSLKKQIEKADITKICDTIIQYVNTNSRNVGQRFSLPLAGRLLRGATRIHLLQVTYFSKFIQKELLAFNQSVKVGELYKLTPPSPAIVAETGARRRDPKRRAKKRPIAQISSGSTGDGGASAPAAAIAAPALIMEELERNVNSFIEGFGHELAAPAPAEAASITLQEAPFLAPVEIEVDAFGDGGFAPVDNFNFGFQQLDTTVPLLSTPVKKRPRRALKRLSESSPSLDGDGPKERAAVRVTSADVHAVQPVTDMPAEIASAVQASESERIHIIQDVALAAPEQRAPSVPAVREVRQGDENLRKKIRVRRNVRINLKKPAKKFEPFEVVALNAIQKVHKLLALHVTVADGLPGESQTSLRVADRGRDEDSANLTRRDITNISSEVQISITSEIGITSTPIIPEPPFAHTLSETIATAADEILQPRELLFDEGEPVVVQIETVEQSPPVADSAQFSRQQDIIDFILKQQKDSKFSVEDLCEKPVSKLNVARCFTDLIVLANSFYLNLYPVEGSSEFAYATRGEKLLNL